MFRSFWEIPRAGIAIDTIDLIALPDDQISVAALTGQTGPDSVIAAPGPWLYQ